MDVGSARQTLELKATLLLMIEHRNGIMTTCGSPLNAI
jgi:hypothetical protein